MSGRFHQQKQALRETKPRSGRDINDEDEGAMNRRKKWHRRNNLEDNTAHR
jgi:hypothetical protein